MATATMEYTGVLEIVECANCHTDFGVQPAFIRARRADHASFYCPFGHTNYYPQKSDLQKQRERAERAERAAADEAARRRAVQDQLDASERSRRAYKGHLTRAKARIAAGVCPVPGCRRSGFTAVMRHIASKHPQWHAEHAQELA